MATHVSILGNTVQYPGEFNEQKNFVGYSPCSPKESDMTEGLTLSLSRPSYFPSVFIASNSVCPKVSVQEILSKRQIISKSDCSTVLSTHCLREGML